MNKTCLDDNIRLISQSTYEEINNTVLVSDNKSDFGQLNEADLHRRSIVNMGHVLDELKRILKHWHNNCTFEDLFVTKHQRLGGKIQYYVEYKMCHHVDTFQSEPQNSDLLDLNKGAVAGAILTGNGYSQMQEIFAAMDIPFMSSDTYQKNHDKM